VALKVCSMNKCWFTKSVAYWPIMRWIQKLRMVILKWTDNLILPWHSNIWSSCLPCWTWQKFVWRLHSDLHWYKYE
jgi:hypothetical protein